MLPARGSPGRNGNAERYDRDRFPIRETSHDDTESSRLLANCHSTNDAFGGGGIVVILLAWRYVF